jgi:hypothetical protein
MPGKGKTAYYFPSREADVISWIRNFVMVLAANAARWGIAEALVTALGSLGMAYEDAYNRRMLPDAGKISVEQKNPALKALKKGVQDMVRFVTASKSPVTLAFREEDQGKTVYMVARWKGHHEQEGNWGGDNFGHYSVNYGRMPV